MAKGTPKGKPVGYGQKGHAFYNQKNYNKSVEGNRHAKNPNLSTKPVGYGANGNAFFSKAKYNASAEGRVHNTSQQGTNPVHQQPHVPMPGHPSQNASSYHGPSTTGTIKPGAIRAPRMK